VNRLPIPVVVAVGTVVGVLTRWMVFESLVSVSIETRTILVNAVGCLLMGLFVRRTWNTQLHTAATLGLCGGLTTFSTFALDAALYLDDSRWTSAVLYVAVTGAASTFAYVLGRQLSASTS